MFRNQRTVYIESVGICEHCGKIVTLEGMPAEAMDAELICSKCNGTLTHKSFGYEEIDGKWKKVKWPGKDGKWTTERPIGGFDLGSWFITVLPPALTF